MTNPKEIAIEKIARILMKSDGMDYAKAMHDDFQLYKNNAEAIIDALDVVFIDDDSEPQKGDLVQFTLSHIGSNGACATNIEKITENYEDLDFGHFEIERAKIIQKNGKPVINVKDVKEND